ncbi:MAG: hypothetical protein KIS81_11255 [Maricaulaceae bacterium]|nr:hypothetical protein [Maricaulaceae bacterium]
MRARFSSVLTTVFAAALLAGCVSVDGAAERARVLDAAGERSDSFPAADAGALLARPLSEDEAAAVALARNAALRAELAEAGLARAAWAQASLPPNPVLEFTSMPPSGGQASWELEARAPLAALLLWPHRQALARGAYDAAQYRAVAAAVDHAAAARRAFTAAVAAAQRAEMFAQVEQAAAAAVLTVEELRAAGNVPALDVERERALHHRAVLARMQADLDARQAHIALARALGAVEDDPRPAASRLPDPEMEAPERDAFVEAAIRASLPLASARAEAERALRAAGAEGVEALLDHAEAGAVFDRHHGATERGWLVEFRPPLFDFAARSAAARIRAEAAADRHAAMAAGVRAAALSAHAGFAAAAARARYVRDELLPASERLLNETMLQYNAMQLGVFDLIAAFEARVAAGTEYVDALEAYHHARITLMTLAQGGTPPDASGAGNGAAMAARGAAGGH